MKGQDGVYSGGMRAEPGGQMERSHRQRQRGGAEEEGDTTRAYKGYKDQPTSHAESGKGMDPRHADLGRKNRRGGRSSAR